MKHARIMSVLIALSFFSGMNKAPSQTPVSDQKKEEKSQAQMEDQKKKHSGLPSETLDKFERTNYGFDYSRRGLMIPMRDGVKLRTVVIVPKGAEGRRRAPGARRSWY